MHPNFPGNYFGNRDLHPQMLEDEEEAMDQDVSPAHSLQVNPPSPYYSDSSTSTSVTSSLTPPEGAMELPEPSPPDPSLLRIKIKVPAEKWGTEKISVRPTDITMDNLFLTLTEFSLTKKHRLDCDSVRVKYKTFDHQFIEIKTNEDIQIGLQNRSETKIPSWFLEFYKKSDQIDADQAGPSS